MPNGMTPEQMLERLFTETVGIDGQGGIKKNVEDIKVDGINGRKKLHEKFDAMKEEMMTKEECGAIRKESGNRRDKILMRLKDLILIGLAIVGFLWGTGVFR